MAPVYARLRLELAVAGEEGIFDPLIFDPAIFDVDTWRDLAGLQDLREEPVVWEYGIRSSDPNDRVAAAGQLRFALDDSEANSQATLGLYSMFNAARRSGFDFNVRTRLALSCPDVAGGADYWKFIGKLADAPADPGATQERLTRCLVLDILDDYTRMDEPDLEPQVGLRMDELLTALLDALATQPDARDIEAGSETYDFAFDGGTGQVLKVRERLSQLAKSEFGFIYAYGGTSPVWTLRAENRSHRGKNPEIMYAFDGTMDLDSPSVPASRDDIVSLVRVTVHPTNDVDSEPVAVLFSITPWSSYVEPGFSTQLFGPYRSPDTNEPCGGTEMVDPPVSGTDYALNSEPDGTGADLAGDFTVTATLTGAGASYSFTNNGTVRGYVMVQARGKPIVRYDADVRKETGSTYGERVLDYDMPYQSRPNVGADVATFLASTRGAPYPRPQAFRFCANQSAALMAAAFGLEPGMRISLTERVTGLSADEFTVNGLRYELEPGGILWCTVFLDPAIAQSFWILGVAGSSELGETTVLGF